MTLKSGWCLDAVQYTFLDQQSYANQLHASCRSSNCTCECHSYLDDE